MATQTFQLQIDPARDNNTPLIATEPIATISANEAFTYQAQAVDQDNDALRFRILDGPEGATIDPITGLLEFDARDQGIEIRTRGDGFISIPADPSLQLQTFTTEGAFNFSDLPPSNGAATIFSQPGSYELFNLGTPNLQLFLEFPNEPNLRTNIPFEVEADRFYYFALVVDDAALTATVYVDGEEVFTTCLLYTSPSPRDQRGSRMPSSA